MESVRDYELKAFFTHVVQVLERLDIPYMVVGGFAAIFYGQPRLTIDVDIIVDMKWRHIEPFVAAFPIPDCYVSEEGIRDSLQRRYPFNVIEPTVGEHDGRRRRARSHRRARVPGSHRSPERRGARSERTEGLEVTGLPRPRRHPGPQLVEVGAGAATAGRNLG